MASNQGESGYDALAPAYDELLRPHGRRLIGLIEAAIDRYRPESTRLCDVGCGTGSALDHFANRGFEVVGVEPSAAMAQAARRRLAGHSQAVIHRAGMLDFTLPAPVDVMISTLEVVNHLQDPGQLARFLGRARRHLDPGGLLWFDASTEAWFRTLWSHRPRIVGEGAARSRWTGSYDPRRRRGVMRVELLASDDSIQIHMRPFEIRAVERAASRAGLEMLQMLALTGVTLGPRTGRIGYLCRRPRATLR